MSLSRITSRLSRTAFNQCRYSLLLSGRLHNHTTYASPIFSGQFHSLRGFRSEVVTGQVSLLHNSTRNLPVLQWFGFSSSASPQSNEKETIQPANEQENKPEGDAAATDAAENAEAPTDAEKNKSGRDTEPHSNVTGSGKRRRGTKRIAFSDSDSDIETDLSRDDLLKLVLEKDELLKVKQEELNAMKDKVLRTYAEMENVMDRTRREAENSKKFAIQNFAKSLLDVADNLGRASSVVKDSFSKMDTSEDTSGALPVLKTLLEGVEMTEKQLAEVFKRFGVEKYDPLNEEFDPNRHNAIFQVPDPSKPAGSVAVVLKAGYKLHDRIIRPAEVGVAVAAGGEEAEKGSGA